MHFLYDFLDFNVRDCFLAMINVLTSLQRSRGLLQSLSKTFDSCAELSYFRLLN